MLKIRLKRTGRKNNPSFRVIVTEVGRSAKTGKVVDSLGFYNPKSKEKEIDTNKAQEWIANGAKPSGTVHNILVDLGAIKGEKVNVLPKKSPIVNEEETEDTASGEVSEEQGESAEAEDEGEGEKESEEVDEGEESPEGEQDVEKEATDNGEEKNEKDEEGDENNEEKKEEEVSGEESENEKDSDTTSEEKSE